MEDTRGHLPMRFRLPLVKRAAIMMGEFTERDLEVIHDHARLHPVQ